MKQQILLSEKGVCTTYSSYNERYNFESKKFQFPLKVCFTMTIDRLSFKGKLLKSREVKARLFLSRAGLHGVFAL